MRLVRLYVSGVIVAALLTSAAVYLLIPGSDPAYLQAALWLSVLSLVAQLLVHQLPGGASGSIAFIPFIATALLAPNWIAVCAVIVANLLTETVSGRGPLKRTFNIAQMTLATSGAILAYVMLGGRSLLLLREGSASAALAAIGFPFIALVVVFVAINTFAVSGAIAANDRKGILTVWRQNHAGGLAYDVLASPVVFFLAWFYAKYGALGAAGLALPLLGVRQLYKTNRQLENVNQELLELMVKAIEARDPYTSGHSRRVSHYSRLIARAVGLNSRQVDRIAVAALLHDVGKIHEIFAPILQKPDRLTPAEWAIMQTHPIKSEELVSTVSQLRDVVAPVRHHHENWDGTGYPDGLAGEQIPLASRVILIADTIDAMTTDRPYRKALTEGQVRAELKRFKGTQFDPGLCDELLSSPMFGLLFASTAGDSTGSRSERSTPARTPKAAAAV